MKLPELPEEPLSAEDELEEAIKEVDAAVRKADRDLALDRIRGEVREIQLLLSRREEGSAGAASELFTSAEEAMELAIQLASKGRYREGMAATASVLRALLSREDASDRTEELTRSVGGGLWKRSTPYLEAFVASLAPRLDHLTHRQLWDELADAEPEDLGLLGEDIYWSETHPKSGRVSRDGYLCHGESARAIGFRTFCNWLEKFSESEPEN